MTTEMNKYKLDTTITAIISNIQFKTKGIYDFSLSDKNQTAIYNFLITRGITTGVRVVFKNDLSSLNEDYTRSVIIEGDHMLRLAYGKNNRKDKFPYVLFVSVDKTPESKFRSYWIRRNLPVSLLDEVISNVQLNTSVQIVVFDTASAWNKQRKSETMPLQFIGQKPDPETNSFVPSRPIGYITKGNRVVISAPDKKLPTGRAYYTFN